jgi:hypothetical protein
MRRPRSGIAAELVPLVLILACLAGTLALVVSVHRRIASRPASTPALAVASPPRPTIPEPPRPIPIPIPAPVPTAPEPEEPEPPPAPLPEDPTPKAVAKLTSAEAEQLLEASRADRKTAALEEARKAALAESERWRRRESLVRLQLDSLDAKVRKLENEVDELALERDALEKERDARKALASQERSRPSQAILPHRGVNGTWRRPIVLECTNGMAILRPQGVGFGLLDMSVGFGPASNPFVATVAREAIRIQGNVSPDGQQVVPYIFFLIRPDGIRAYYEARGRLEPLGITFGYELADQDWEVEFPDLNDMKTWDGSGPSRPEGEDPLAQLRKSPAAGSPAEDEDFPAWGTSSPKGDSPAEFPGGEFTWPPKAQTSNRGGGRIALGNLGGSGAGAGLGGSGTTGTSPRAPAGIPDGVDPLGGLPAGKAGRSGSGPVDPPVAAIPGELKLGGQPIKPLEPSTGNVGAAIEPGSSQVPPSSRERSERPAPSPLVGEGAAASPGVTNRASDPSQSIVKGQVDVARPLSPTLSHEGRGGQKMPDVVDSQALAKDDPANTFVWPSQPRAGSRKPQGDPGSTDSSPPVPHTGPFNRPLAMGLDSMATPNGPTSPNSPTDADPTQPDGTSNAASGSQNPNPNQARAGASGRTPGVPGSSGSQANSKVIGSSDATGTPPPSGTVGVGMGGMPPMGGQPAQASATDSPPESKPKKGSPALLDPSTSSIVDRRFEVVVVCGPRGVIVQPGGYRVTVDALKDRDGLMKKQIVALVKAKRTADPKVSFEPKIRFLVQPGGDKTFWAARSQFLLSGLNWPMSTQVADPDHVSIIPSESW